MKTADLTNHTRKTASYMYANFILLNPSDEDVVIVNKNIIERWSEAAGYNVGF